MKTETMDPRDRRRVERKAELTQELSKLGITVAPYVERAWSDHLRASVPATPDVEIELMHQDRGFAEAWMVGRKHGSAQRRRFPLREKGRGFNYAGIAAAIHEQIAQKLRLREQIAATKKMLAAQDEADAVKLAVIEEARALMVKWKAIEEGDRRVKARSDGLQISIEHRAPRTEPDAPRLRVSLQVREIQTASDACQMIAGLKIAGLWL